eukprot:1010211-Rhodomonas_salina.4
MNERLALGPMDMTYEQLSRIQEPSTGQGVRGKLAGCPYGPARSGFEQPFVSAEASKSNTRKSQQGPLFKTKLSRGRKMKGGKNN